MSDQIEFFSVDILLDNSYNINGSGRRVEVGGCDEQRTTVSKGFAQKLCLFNINFV